MSQTLMTRVAIHVATAVNDTCDRCGAAAKVQIKLTRGGELTFCGHHANRYADDIRQVAQRVVIESTFAWRGVG